jgi:hypothetical protein
MKRIELTVATSHTDLHGDVVTPEALARMATQINTSYIPLGTNHDPRIPPHGRLISARIEVLEDGETALWAIGDIFEPGDIVPFLDDGREVPLSGVFGDQLHLVFDRTFNDEASWTAIKELSNILGNEPQIEGKKALEPISVLALAGTFALGGIAAGFLKKIGSDIADAVTGRLKRLIVRDHEDSERLFSVRIYLEHDGRPIETEVIVTNPKPEELEFLLSEGLQRLDVLTQVTLKEFPETKRMVFELKNGEITFSFGIRRDAFPLLMKK